jgi:hypothetical protein
MSLRQGTDAGKRAQHEHRCARAAQGVHGQMSFVAELQASTALAVRRLHGQKSITTPAAERVHVEYAIAAPAAGGVHGQRMGSIPN